MPVTVQLFRVLLAAPSDVIEEQALVADAINDWNIQHGESDEARVELMNWRTHAHPEAGRRPQAQSAVRRPRRYCACDLLAQIRKSNREGLVGDGGGSRACPKTAQESDGILLPASRNRRRTARSTRTIQGAAVPA